MHWRRFLPTLAILLTAVVSLVGATYPAQASPSRGYSAPTEGAKVTLGDTSIDGPAITAAPGVGTVLAWTGTDSAHARNVELISTPAFAVKDRGDGITCVSFVRTLHVHQDNGPPACGRERSVPG